MMIKPIKLLQSRLRKFWLNPSEVGAFQMLQFLDKHNTSISRAGLEVKTLNSIPNDQTPNQLEKACLTIRDVMVDNESYAQACYLFEIIERACHNEAKRRDLKEAKRPCLQMNKFSTS